MLEAAGCPTATCWALADGVLLYHFRSHLTACHWLVRSCGFNLIGRRSSSACHPEVPQQRLPYLIWKWTFRFHLTSHNAFSIGRHGLPKDAPLEMLRSLRTTTTTLQPFYGPPVLCLGLPRWAGTRKVKPMSPKSSNLNPNFSVMEAGREMRFGVFKSTRRGLYNPNHKT